jgi:hypothetical protein
MKKLRRKSRPQMRRRSRIAGRDEDIYMEIIVSLSLVFFVQAARHF